MTAVDTHAISFEAFLLGALTSTSLSRIRLQCPRAVVLSIVLFTPASALNSFEPLFVVLGENAEESVIGLIRMNV